MAAHAKTQTVFAQIPATASQPRKQSLQVSALAEGRLERIAKVAAVTIKEEGNLKVGGVFKYRIGDTIDRFLYVIGMGMIIKSLFYRKHYDLEQGHGKPFFE